MPYQVQAERPNPYHGENNVLFALSAVAVSIHTPRAPGDIVTLEFTEAVANIICDQLNDDEPDTWHVVEV